MRICARYTLLKTDAKKDSVIKPGHFNCKNVMESSLFKASPKEKRMLVAFKEGQKVQKERLVESLCIEAYATLEVREWAIG